MDFGSSTRSIAKKGTRILRRSKDYQSSLVLLFLLTCCSIVLTPSSVLGLSVPVEVSMIRVFSMSLEDTHSGMWLLCISYFSSKARWLWFLVFLLFSRSIFYSWSLSLLSNFVMSSSQTFFPSSMISSVSNIPFCTASQVGLLSMFNGVNSLPNPKSDVLRVWEYTLVLSPLKKVAVGARILVPSCLPGDDDLLSWEFISGIMEVVSKSETGSDFRVQLKALGYMSPPDFDEIDALPFEAGISYVHRFPLKFSLMVIDGTTPFGSIILDAVMESPAPVDDDQSSSFSAVGDEPPRKKVKVQGLDDSTVPLSNPGGPVEQVPTAAVTLSGDGNSTCTRGKWVV
jgi:hypothetical protein